MVWLAITLKSIKRGSNILVDWGSQTADFKCGIAVLGRSTRHFINPIEEDKKRMPKMRRTKSQDLPKAKQQLTPDQAKRVKGGLANHPGGVNVVWGDGSVRNIVDGTSNTLLPAIQKK